MPDVLSIGLGGGSVVREKEDGSVTVGPDSAGFELTKKAMVFGGDVMTATDIAVRLGMADIGDASLVKDIPQETAKKVLDAIRTLVEDAIDMAVESGAVRETVEIIDVEDFPLQYYPGNTNRVKIKAAGALKA